MKLGGKTYNMRKTLLFLLFLFITSQVNANQFDGFWQAKNKNSFVKVKEGDGFYWRDITIKNNIPFILDLENGKNYMEGSIQNNKIHLSNKYWDLNGEIQKNVINVNIFQKLDSSVSKYDEIIPKRYFFTYQRLAFCRRTSTEEVYIVNYNDGCNPNENITSYEYCEDEEKRYTKKYTNACYTFDKNKQIAEEKKEPKEKEEKEKQKKKRKNA